MKSVSPGKVIGELKAPPSKSMAQRAIAAASLIEGTSTIIMGTPCDDIESALRAVIGLGARVSRGVGQVLVEGKSVPKQEEIDCGEAGLCLRMFSAVGALFEGKTTLQARGSLASRPVDMLAGPLLQLGAKCATNDGFPPVVLEGPMVGGGTVTVNATESSQFLTGLIIALTHCNGTTNVLAPGLKSKPYVQMTIDLLRSLGAKIETKNDLEDITIWGNQTFSSFTYDVPGDWSGAAFLLVAAAIAGKLTVRGIDTTSSQADRKILDALSLCGAKVSIVGQSVTVESEALKAFEFDATHCPDLFPPLAALAANSQGVSKISGVHRLATKECNREKAIIDEFGKIGILITVQGDQMHIQGGSAHGATVYSHNDHRIAMAMGVAALTASGPVNIEGDESINKSYPDFFVDMAKVGAIIQ